jgi:membrane protein implicated in regulation of membrane protease activity
VVILSLRRSPGGAWLAGPTISVNSSARPPAATPPDRPRAPVTRALQVCWQRMSAWVIWVVAAGVLFAIEATTTAFVAVYFGVAAAITAVLAVLGLPLPLQLAAFAAVSVGGMLLTRPALKRLASTAPVMRSGVDAMRGRRGIVTKPIAELDPGLVKVEGEIWTARCYFEGEPIAEGTRIEVVEVRGVTALVVPAPSPYEIPEQGASSSD